ncbi:DUF2358 domain-containing protein [Lyngbya sp. CCY1209]|jgi:hypothetical protein|uniref:DUF2358 domain-containing protein n=1 Tax=Lyngbya sp. CCY1209 TaxID=2886103 RepID=UPI002D1FF200|nr:DUF2358 domain-containing protein [Lyngbya sp. CCY1209]MEB3883827.1 DUF2358 domain-containing protein [Lyngbya sp. CCY1209]
MVPTDLLEILKRDYQNFPADQTYAIYAEDVYFKDPVNEFSGRDRYQKMIGFMETWFKDIQLDLHGISESGDTIETRWTLSWTVSVLPWRPRVSVPGRSELHVNSEGAIDSHIDYWNCSRLAVLGQVFQQTRR